MPRLFALLERYWVQRLHIVLFTLIMIAWTIALLSPVPEEEARRVLGGPEGMFYFGKTLHVVAYLLLTIFGCCIVQLRFTWPWLAISIAVHGVVIELIQPHVGRTGRWQDAALDGLGVLIGTVIVRWWWRMVGRPTPASVVAAPSLPNSYSTPTNPTGTR